jgi:hypothetical protein
MKYTASTLKILAVAAGFLVLGACNSINKGANSNSMLTVDSITGTTIDGTESMTLESDVSTTTADSATVSLTASLVDASGGTTPTQYNNVTLTGYTIDYTLPDGTGTPGTDVPNSVEGVCSTLLIEIGSTSSVTFIAVPADLKAAVPLSGWVGSTTLHTLVAHITFIGHDGNNHEVKTTGQLTIVFSDYADVI